MLPPTNFIRENEMTENLLAMVESATLEAGNIEATTRRIHDEILAESQYLRTPNFRTIHPADLRLLFARYDHEFFDGLVGETLGGSPLRFRLSNRMTSSGGMTTRKTDPRDGSHRYEISVSTALLFGCFGGDDHRPITASGIACHDRVDALQRVMEHEIIHVVEILLWDKSSCARPRFQHMSHRFFAHTDYTHRLITPREKAQAKYGIRPGMTVRFRCNGLEKTGMIRRINKRASVLVEDRDGEPYSNGKRYSTFYVPPRLLEIVE
jgi:hypothetical protein